MLLDQDQYAVAADRTKSAIIAAGRWEQAFVVLAQSERR
jgi:hypothetical protein